MIIDTDPAMFGGALNVISQRDPGCGLPVSDFSWRGGTGAPEAWDQGLAHLHHTPHLPLTSCVLQGQCKLPVAHPSNGNGYSDLDPGKDRAESWTGQMAQ